ncbi:MAG TPA: sigma-70 family RNA polymerase sigma factor [Corynebacterium sp.]|nr:sigma-70 family RNA polymerase sigma factor [Corynebacterium sp.]
MADLSAEKILLEQARAGDERAFAELIAGAQRRMWAVAWSVTGNRSDAEDALQNALISIWRNLPEFQPRARFSTWAYRITSNAALQIVRARRDLPDPDAGAAEIAPLSSVGNRVSASLVLREGLATLAPEFREALVLREYAGLSYRDIAAQQQVPVATVKSRLNRARTRLREALEALGLSASDISGSSSG